MLKGVDVSVENGQTLAIVGRSGCGKTTLLKIIAGLLIPTGGGIFIDEIKINQLPVHRREVVYMFQEPLLFPQLSVSENIAFGLRIRKVNETVVKTQTHEMLERLLLTGFEKRLPHELSGGQKQRTAFGRALIIKPKLLLLDEPFSNLDVETRESMQQFYLEMQRLFQLACIFVTHDLKEALTIGQRFGWLHDGKLTTFNDAHTFAQDPGIGAEKEIQFWKKFMP